MLLFALLACAHDADRVTAPPAPLSPPTWPDPAAPLKIVSPAPLPAPRRVMIDAGHGAPRNLGNTNVHCEREAAVTLRAQDAVIARLQGKPGVELRAGRPGSAIREYDDRIADMNAWAADAVISIHTDARAGDGWTRQDNGCYTSTGGLGFAVLYSDEGTLADRRRELARAVATRMGEAGFLPYDGKDYPGLYDNEGGGVFVDRHPDRQRIKMLRRPAVPLVIVETHQATNPAEADRWEQPETLDAFAAAVYAAVTDLRYPAQDAGPGPQP